MSVTNNVFVMEYILTGCKEKIIISYLTLNSYVTTRTCMRPSYVESNIWMHDSTLCKSLYSNTISSLAAQSEEDVSTFSNCSSSTKNVSTNHVSRAANDQQDMCSLMDLGFKCKGFRIGHINIEGLNNKIDQVRLLLSSEQNKIQILGLSETKLRNFHPVTVYEIDGYQKPFRRDRKENEGMAF